MADSFLQASRDATGAAEQLEVVQRLTRQLVQRLPHMLIQTVADWCLLCRQAETQQVQQNSLRRCDG